MSFRKMDSIHTWGSIVETTFNIKPNHYRQIDSSSRAIAATNEINMIEKKLYFWINVNCGAASVRFYDPIGNSRQHKRWMYLHERRKCKLFAAQQQPVVKENVVQWWKFHDPHELFMTSPTGCFFFVRRNVDDDEWDEGGWANGNSKNKWPKLFHTYTRMDFNWLLDTIYVFSSIWHSTERREKPFTDSHSFSLWSKILNWFSSHDSVWNGYKALQKRTESCIDSSSLLLAWNANFCCSHDAERWGRVTHSNYNLFNNCWRKA
jgi:hypothetical protein